MRHILRTLRSTIYELKQWVSFWLSHFQNRKIATGAAKGLQFNTFRGSADYLAGNNEQPVQDFLATYLKPGDVFFDVGANIGFFSICAAHLVGDEGSVYAFEPIPLNIACIQRNIRINQFQNIDIFPTAVSDADGRVTIQVTYHPGGATLENAGNPVDAYQTMAVNTIKLDSLLAKSKIKVPTLVKIDVEGAEYPVLKGMQKLLAKYHPMILYEIDAADKADFHDKQAQCRAFLEAAGYHISELSDAYPDIDHHIGHFAAFSSN